MIVDEAQCKSSEDLPTILHCIWVVVLGKDGLCKNVVVGCDSITNNEEWCETPGAAGNDNECIWISSGTKVGCQKILDTCTDISDINNDGDEEWCETGGAVVDENGKRSNCFWLYTENEGDNGNCKSKDDATLTCSNLKRKEQCEGVDVFELKNKCFWLEGNTDMEIPAECINMVCIKSLTCFVFFFFLFFFSFSFVFVCLFIYFHLFLFIYLYVRIYIYCLFHLLFLFSIITFYLFTFRSDVFVLGGVKL
jgi:hypothetical protein